MGEQKKPAAKKKATVKKTPAKKNRAAAKPNVKEDFYIVGMGASAGGLEAFERFFQNMPNDSGNDAVTLQDFEGNILDWNKGAERMYGYTKAEALKLNINDIIPKEKQKETLGMIKKIKEGDDIKSFKTKRKAKDGKILDVWLTVTKLVDTESNPTQIATTERDLVWLSEQ